MHPFVTHDDNRENKVHIKEENDFRGWMHALVVEYLTHFHEDLGSIASKTKAKSSPKEANFMLCILDT